MPWLAHTLLLAAAAGAAGCAADAERDNFLKASRAAMEAKPVCCTGSREFLYPRMAIPFESTFFIDRSAPVYAFPKGKSYFRSFELPPYERPYVLEVESHLMGGPMADGQWLFQPVMLFLGDNHQVVGLMRDLKFRPLLGGAHVRGMGMQVVLDERARRARYLVIYTEPDAMSRALEFRTVSMGMANNRDYAFPFGYEGRLTLRASAVIPAAPQ